MSAPEHLPHPSAVQSQPSGPGVPLWGKLLQALRQLTLRWLTRSSSQPARSCAADRDQRLIGRSALPVAVDLSQVGNYPARVQSGGGYFYDDVLEYRVWLHPERGAEHRSGEADYFLAFAQYELALDYALSQPGTEAPLVLVRQLRYIDEPAPGQMEVIDSERLTEWQVEWLADAKWDDAVVADFLGNP